MLEGARRFGGGRLRSGLKVGLGACVSDVRVRAGNRLEWQTVTFESLWYSVMELLQRSLGCKESCRGLRLRQY